MVRKALSIYVLLDAIYGLTKILYAILAIVIANAQLRVVSTILECGGLSPAARAVGGTLVYHQPLEALITAGRTGHLQLYSTTTNKVLYNVRSRFSYFILFSFVNTFFNPFTWVWVWEESDVGNSCTHILTHLFNEPNSIIIYKET